MNTNSVLKSLAFIFAAACAGLVLFGLSALAFTAQETAGETHRPAEVIDAMHTAFGNNHSRAVHAKGVILEGTFTPDSNAKELTKAPHLQSQKSKVTVRFSDFTGIPTIPDTSPLANPRGMAIKFHLADGSTTDLVTHSFNGFPVPNTDQFRELMLAIGASGPDATKPTALDKFLDSHPIAKTFLTTQKTPASYATISYFGVNSFKFTNEKGESHFVRYQIVPARGEELLTPEQLKSKDPNYLVDEIKTRAASQPFAFEMFAQLAESSDRIDDPSVAWSDRRKRVLLGRLLVNQLAPNTVQEDKALFFIPNNLPEGIATADPMLDFRSKAYPISVKERQ